MTCYKIFLFSLLLFAIPTMPAQNQLKQFGTKLFDETGRSVKLSDAIEISKPKSEKAYIAFRLAEGLSDGRIDDILSGYTYAALALVPLGRDGSGWNLRYSWANAYFAILSIANIGLTTNKKEIEEVLAIGVKAFNESSTSNE